jgi:hypothetical protein
MAGKANTPIHGHARRGKISPTFRSWNGMVNRCTSPTSDHWAQYGGRGITVCDRWLKFENFLADLGERPDGKTLERRNNSEGYNPDNCGWASRKTQNRNRRSIKLDEAKAAAIRASTEKPRVLAARYGVNRNAIRQIRTGKRWAPDG